MSTPPDLGPLPEPVARMSPDGKSLIREATYVYGVKSGDELFSRVNGFTVTLHTSDQTRDFGQRCYMLGVAAASQWRPIETAPKDGSLFLCWVAAVRYGETDEGQPYEQDASQVDFCSWSDGPPDLPGHGYFDPCCGRIGDSQGVTHWMPLPSAPTKEGG